MDLNGNMSCLGLLRATSSSFPRCCTTKERSWPRVWRAWGCSLSCQREATSWSQTSPQSVSDELCFIHLSSSEISIYLFVFFPQTEVDLNDLSTKDELYDFRFVKWLIKEKVKM